MKYNAAYGYHTKQEKVRNEQFTKKFKKKNVYYIVLIRSSDSLVSKNVI